MGEKKKCKLCEHNRICSKLTKYAQNRNVKYKNKFSRKLCKDIKANPVLMARLVELAIIGG